MNGWPVVLAVAVGGAAGALLRYGASVLLSPLAPRTFYAATLLINVLGSLALGMLYGVTQSREVRVVWVALLGVGLLGAFTTFSTFAVELLRLQQAGRGVEGLGYAIGGVAASFAAAWAGYLLVHSWLAR